MTRQTWQMDEEEWRAHKRVLRLLGYPLTDAIAERAWQLQEQVVSKLRASGREMTLQEITSSLGLVDGHLSRVGGALRTLRLMGLVLEREGTLEPGGYVPSRYRLVRRETRQWR